MTNHVPSSHTDAPQTVRQRLEGLFVELAQVSQRGLPLAEYCPAVVDRVVGFLGATAGAVWLPVSDCDLEAHGDAKFAGMFNGASVQHQELIEDIVDCGEPLVVSPSSENGEGEFQNPTDWTLVVGIVGIGVDAAGALEIIFPSGLSADSREGFLRLVTMAADFIAERLPRMKMGEVQPTPAPVQPTPVQPTPTPTVAAPSSAPSSQDTTFLADLDQFSRSIHGSLDLRRTCFQIASEGARLLTCDRVSVAVIRGKACRIVAVSGREQFDRRSNAMRLMEKLTTAALRAQEPLWYDGRPQALAPQLDSAIRAYLDETFVKCLAVLPLAQPTNPDSKEPANILGALILEQIEETTFPDHVRPRVESLSTHAVLALQNAQQHEGLFLLPLWRMLGRVWRFSTGSGRRKVISALAVVLLLAVALAVIPADFSVEARGELQPITQQDVFAQETGVVQAVHVRHGDQVQAGQLLAELRNVELDVRLTEVRGQWSSADEELKAIDASLLNSQQRLEPSVREQLLGRKRQIEETLRTLSLQLRLLEQRRELLQITSPIAGRISTLDTQQRLLHRPVERGQQLLSVAESAGKWELHVHLPEDRLGHLQNAQQTAGGQPLSVRFIVANEPGSEIRGELADVQQRAEVHDDLGQTVVLKVKIDPQQVAHLRQGANVIARVECGRRPVGYVWLHGVWEFFQSRIWFRL